eukprot:7851057-Pyramimonas_sp.AAC.2
MASSKSAIPTNCSATKKRSIESMKSKSICIQTPSFVEGLGIDAALGRRRTTSTRRKRTKQARERASRA